jgi:hypothetical protein
LFGFASFSWTITGNVNRMIFFPDGMQQQDQLCTSPISSPISFLRLHTTNRYLMSRLSLHVFYLWRHVLSTAPPFIYYGGKIYKYYLPPSTAALPSYEGCAVKQFKRNTVRIQQKEPPKSSLYCEMPMTCTAQPNTVNSKISASCTVSHKPIIAIKKMVQHTVLWYFLPIGF